MNAVHPSTSPTSHWEAGLSAFRCSGCGSSLELEEAASSARCTGCGVRMPIRDGILVVEESATANNAVAQRFYDGPLWPKFRFWEWFTFLCNGGERRARRRVLRHLPDLNEAKLLDVAIGDGVYLDWLPPSWSVFGVDVSETQLKGCLATPRQATRPLWLAQCPAEELPFPDNHFDAVLSIGAFNYFNDPERALLEMGRVAKPGVPVVVSDEAPNLTDRLIGRKLGWSGLDRWIMSKGMKLGDEFTDLVERHRDLDVEGLARRVFSDCTFERIWQGVGYVFVGHAPDRHV